jgi:hypothetical protein
VRLVLGIASIWFGGLLVYVGVHGIDGGFTGVSGIFRQALADVRGTPAQSGATDG